VDTGGDERVPIILGRPFLCTVKAIIYEEHAKIVIFIKDKKEKFSFKERILHCHTRFSKEQNQANHMCTQEAHTYVRMEKY
jgi:hypothetical protein